MSFDHAARHAAGTNAAPPDRPTRWQLSATALDLTRGPLFMGIVNVTPDSFSDGGTYDSTQKAVDRALTLIDDGADVIDVGGESTRPYADKVSQSEELERVIPVLKQLASKTKVPLSIDTSKAEVARQAVLCGAQIVNDVTGLEGDPDMVDVVRENRVGVCVMHMQGTPQNMQDNPTYDDVIVEVAAYLARRRDDLTAAGIPTAYLCLDPGIGFGKTHAHNLQLMSQCHLLHRLGCPLLVGHSRKGFLGKLLQDKQRDRTYATVGAALSLAAQGVQIIRVHDVRPLREALVAFLATGGAPATPLAARGAAE